MNDCTTTQREVKGNFSLYVSSIKIDRVVVVCRCVPRVYCGLSNFSKTTGFDLILCFGPDGRVGLSGCLLFRLVLC